MNTQAQSLKDQADQLWEQGKLDSAIQHYQQALEINPDFFQAHANLGSVLAKTEDYENAIKHYEEAISLQPEIAALYSNTAEILNNMKQFEEAKEFSHAALKRQNEFLPAINNLGVALFNLGDIDDAIAVFNRALKIDSDAYEAWSNLGDCYRLAGNPVEARKCFNRSIQLKPDIALTYHKLSVVEWKLGLYDEHIASIRRALALDPNLHITRSNYLFIAHARGILSTAELHKEFLKWDEIHGSEGRANRFKHSKSTAQDKKRRIGYLSPDFHTHSVSFFFESIITQHDKSKFEIYCYANVPRPDDVTERLQKHADSWRDIYGMTDIEIATLIHNDKIDVLIDLAGHTGFNRLKVFTYKPAPIQATYLGGATTTGLRDMDYWITDNIIHPKDTPDNIAEPSSEEKYRLPRCFYSFTPPANTPDVLPQSRALQLTFGSFNDFRKLTETTIEMWAAVLNAVPESVMLLKHRSLNNPQQQQWVLDQFKHHHVATSRIQFSGHSENHRDHFDQYNNIDVALDPYPFTGATTTIDTLWMGVPTVTLAGNTMASRYSASFSHAVGLDDLITNTLEDYVTVAKKLITDKERLMRLRETLRETMQNSELCDGPGLTRALEDFYVIAYEKYLNA